MEQEVIAAIHKSIMDKWDPICMGYKADAGSGDCALCHLFEQCWMCPFDGVCDTGEYHFWRGHLRKAHLCGRKRICCPTCAERAEAVLEKLVTLLPPGERKIYDG